MQLAEDQQWPKHFSSASHAIRWADGYRAADHTQTCTAVVMRNAVKRRGNQPIDEHGLRITRDRLIDQANTIGVAFDALEKPASRAYRYVYGGLQACPDIVDGLAFMVWDIHGVEYITALGQFKILSGLVLLEAQRDRRISRAAMADSISVSLRQFERKWVSPVKDLRRHRDQLINRTDKEFTAALIGLGMF